MKKKKVLIIGGAGILAVFGFTLAGFALKTPANTHIAIAEETETVSSEDVDTAEIVEQATEETTNKFKEIWQTYLLPALLSINITSVAAAIVSIILAVKNHNNHKKYNIKIETVVTIVGGLIDQMTQCLLLVAERNKQTENLIVALQEARDVAKQQIALVPKEADAFQKLANAVAAFVNVETELVKNDPNYVTSGVAAEIVEIKKQLYEVLVK